MSSISKPASEADAADLDFRICHLTLTASFSFLFLKSGAVRLLASLRAQTPLSVCTILASVIPIVSFPSCEVH